MQKIVFLFLIVLSIAFAEIADCSLSGECTPIHPTSLKNLEPSLLFNLFYKITQIPRPSGHEQKIIEFLKKIAAEHSFHFQQDAFGNVLLTIPPTTGNSNKGIIIQAHLDMVCEVASNVKHDCLKDPIPIEVDEEYIKTKGTSLGADNGAGVALALALAIQSLKKFNHPQIELLFTVQEELGLVGAKNLELKLKGEIFLNLDQFVFGTLFIGSAGGLRTAGTFTSKNFDKVVIDYESGYIPYKMLLTGLKGGHSGIDINSKRGNAIVLLAKLLKKLSKDVVYQIREFSGGTKVNAIPREAHVILWIDFLKYKDIAFKIINEFLNETKKEIEENISIKFIGENPEIHENLITVFPKEFEEKIINVILELPNGVIKMNKYMPDVVETSTNLAIISTNNNSVTIETNHRSLFDEENAKIGEKVKSVFTKYGGSVIQDRKYTSWRPDTENPLLKISSEIYKTKFGNYPNISAVHCGIENSVIKEKFPHLEMISFGPTILDAHSPNERLHIQSFIKSFYLLEEIVKKLSQLK